MFDMFSVLLLSAIIGIFWLAWIISRSTEDGCEKSHIPPPFKTQQKHDYKDTQ